MVTMVELFQLMNERGASDLHITVGAPPVLRIDGELVPTPFEKLTREMTQTLIYSMLSEAQCQRFEAQNELDLAFNMRGVGRMRMNVYRQTGAVGAAVRSIPSSFKTFDEIGLPQAIMDIVKLPKGLVLVTGPTGSGKSTTIASMIDFINETRSAHIMTVEDPIEFIHTHKKSIINQREVGQDTETFAAALRRVLRQDPNVILIGELRDLETISAALNIAETGHLVLATLHTTDCAQTINRIIDLYPPHQQAQVRYQLADVLKGVVCQRLIPRASGSGRIPACEVLVVTALVRKAIAENQMHDVQEAIRQGQYYGMETFHQALLKLYKEGHIRLEDALEAASNPEELMMAIRGITNSTEGVA
jgi:twitching motility protein PilT